MAKYIEGGPLEELRAIQPQNIVVFDTETTGTNAGKDEILQISFIDGAGNVLLDTFVKPQKATEWKEAEGIHGITPEMVDDAPIFSDIKKQVEELIRSAELLVAYNLSFDLGFIRAQGISTRKGQKQFDVMKEYAPVHGKWAGWKNDWQWVSLAECAEHYGFTFAAHNALEDSRVTLKCFRAILNDNAPGGYLDLHANPAKLNINNPYWYDKTDQNAIPNYQRQINQQQATQQITTKKKGGAGFWVLSCLAVLFIIGAFGGAGMTSFLIGVACGVGAWFMKKKKGS